MRASRLLPCFLHFNYYDTLTAVAQPFHRIRTNETVMHADITNVFTPALAVQDVARFAGRQEQLEKLSLALQSGGTQIVIYGNRGVGKSSLARQLSSLANGDAAVLERLSLKPTATPDWLVVHLECDDTLPDVRSLILRLLTDEGALAPWIPFRVEKQTVGAEASATLNVKVFTLAAKGTGNATLQREVAETDIYSAFSNAIKHVIDSGVTNHGILFVIDEVDRIKQRDELASVIRSRAADPKVKFALVGVAQTPQELILNHESIARQISDGCIEMPPMSDTELREIFDKAHNLLEKDNIIFSEDAIAWITEVAKGHPYYVHLLGKHSLLSAVTRGERTVTRQIAESALSEIAIKGTAKIQESTYSRAIGHSYTREYILKEFAKANGDEINTTSVYSKISTALSVDASSISVYVGQLANDKFGPVIEKTRERHYRFKDSLFKAYAAARPFNYTKEQLEAED